MKLHFPIDYRIANKFSSEAKVEFATDKTGIPDDWMALDCGPKTSTKNAQVIWRAKTIIVNGSVESGGKREKGKRTRERGIHTQSTHIYIYHTLLQPRHTTWAGIVM